MIASATLLAMGAALGQSDYVAYRAKRAVTSAGQLLTAWGTRSRESVADRRAKELFAWRNLWSEEADWSIARATRNFTEFYHGQPAPFQRFIRASGMAPPSLAESDAALITCTNLDWGTVLSSQVFAKHPNRGYALRPNQESLWTDFHLTNRAAATYFFLVPASGEVLESLQDPDLVGHELMQSRQHTNSWGFRGSEPNPTAEHRVMVIGDSYMHGVFLGDDDTPPMQLERQLQSKLDGSVSVLNASVMGYGPIQYYDLLMEYVDRFRPHVVLVSVCANDLGRRGDEVLDGAGDSWEQAVFFLRRIRSECVARDIDCVFCPVSEIATLRPQSSRSYHDQLRSRLLADSYSFCTVTQAFAQAELRLDPQLARTGERSKPCALLANDGHHYSKTAAAIWGTEIAEFLEPRLTESR